MDAQLTRHRFTVDEYHWMARVGILREDERVELIDGQIVELPTVDPAHAARVTERNERFTRWFDDEAQVRVKLPILLDRYSEPRPHLVLARPRQDGYRLAPPAPEDVLLAVEIADTALMTSRRLRISRYAVAGILETWLIDLELGAVHVYREPGPGGYGSTSTLRRGQWLAPLAFSGREIAGIDLLG